MEKKINYIIGIGRSGSTLLSTLLNAHSAIKAIPEIPITIFFSSRYQHLKKREPKLEQQTKIYLNLIQKIRPLDLVNLHAENVFNDKVDYKDYQSFIQCVFAQFTIAGKTGPSEQYIDKNPFYSFHYQRLKKINTTSKFILLVRDYRANVLSRNKKVLNKPGNIVYNAFRWRFFFQALSKIKNNSDCLVVRYEDLVANEISEMMKICHFLEVAYEPDMFNKRMVNNLSDQVEMKKTKKFVEQHFIGLSQPIHTHKINEWRKDLTQKEINQCDCICGKYGKDYNYAPASYKNLSYFILVIKNFHWYIRALYDIYKEQFIYHLPIKMKLLRLGKKII